MIKNIAMVSLSSGILGEAHVKHEVDIGLKRLGEYGVNVRFMPHALTGLDYVQKHPEDRAQDLIDAFLDDEVDMILCAIGGDDTYRLLPHLFENDELQKAVRSKVFLGFSDTTINHLMLHKVGLNTFYGQAFLPDVCELSQEMLPYTRQYFEELLRTGTISRIEPSPVWYSERTLWGTDQVGVDMPEHEDTGFELLQGSGRFEGRILGGCLESMYDIFTTDRYPDMAELCGRYGLFPAADEWKGHILLLETSEEKPSPELFGRMLAILKNTGVFGAVSGILMGKPLNEINSAEYKRLLVEAVDDPSLPIVANINVGHATPRCIIPFGIPAIVDVEKQSIVFGSSAGREN